jgi:capsular exopolysaccharide synthesis family protein
VTQRGNSQAALSQHEVPPVRDYVQVLLRRKWTIIVIVGTVLASALLASARQTPIYESNGEVLLRSGDISSDTTLTQPINLETERTVASSDAVAQIAAKELGVSPEGVQSGLSVDIAASTEILIFTFRHPDATVAQERAAAFSEAYLEYRRRQVLGDMLAASETVQQRISELNAELDRINTRIAKPRNPVRDVALQSRSNALIGQIAILQQKLADLSPADKLRVGQVVDHPALPQVPTSPNHLRNGLLGLFAGLILGILIAFLREQLDDSLKGKSDLETTSGTAVLAAIPRVPQWKNDTPLTITLAEPKSPAAEAYRKLRTGVVYSAVASQAKVLMITSPHENEGKTATTSNLGVVLAQADKKVIVVSADLRKPRLHLFFRLDNTIGVTNVLTGEVSPRQALRTTDIENLQLLGSGPIPHNPAELLASDAMKSLLEKLREVADFVLIDAPPVIAVADPIAMVPLIDGVLFVADAKTSTRGMVEQACRQLNQVNANLSGAILNNCDAVRSDDYYYYYGTQSYAGESTSGKKMDRIPFIPRRSASRSGQSLHDPT